MSAVDLVSDEVQPGPTPSQPRGVAGLATTGLVVALAGLALAVAAALRLHSYSKGAAVPTGVGVLLVLAALYPLLPTARAYARSGRRSTLLGEGQLVASRRAAAAGRDEATVAMGYAVGAAIVSVLLLIALAQDGGIAQTFFAGHSWKLAFPEMIQAFWTNIWVACVAQVLVLVFGLLLAVMRMLPGRAGRPLRLIALIYCDVFRAIPALVTILLIVFGLPLAFPALANWPSAWLGAVALTMTYSAYVAEVYRAGLSSIHPSQSAAARSLGLSYAQTLRTVLVPQAVRRVIPPLLNDFISLQKDTALLTIAGIVEVVNASTLWQSKLFNLSPVTLAALFFIVVTIPQARFVDFLIDRDAARRSGR
ncbi:amino acid ABC transporter permease [Nocardioides mangrovicus]|uniref:Amino acid ABC transporter permease n=1 Tax=Nocardioides mangrovicus TaxID=2478913 RepID=A0A3L8P6C2_9ACTN|nr:amino acid ABC transporter permease [Nocardioides mangrovicus]RLV50950.1 amino acid ABC transporter permease [Nocardioides mangrovicus]